MSKFLVYVAMVMALHNWMEREDEKLMKVYKINQGMFDILEYILEEF
jgi:hypothetical protein